MLHDSKQLTTGWRCWRIENAVLRCEMMAIGVMNEAEVTRALREAVEDCVLDRLLA